MKIIKLNRKHVVQISKIHQNELNFGVFDLFGIKFLEKMYLKKLKFNWGFVAISRKKIIGFIFANKKNTSFINYLSFYTIIIFFFNIFKKFDRFILFLKIFYKVYIDKSWNKKISPNNKVIELFSIVVKEKFKGKGVGKKLIKAFEKKAKTDGFKFIYTRTHNYRLEKFYYRTRKAFLVEKLFLKTYDLMVVKWKL
jgi:GNAT superfamily N-acetyltransferase